MPLRPATFAPYPAPDKRAAARERYLRALEEARKAKQGVDVVDGRKTTPLGMMTMAFEIETAQYVVSCDCSTFVH